MTSAPMQRALALAREVLGSTSPNPSVGCVIMRDGHIVAEGATRPAGGPHAEAVALEAAGTAANGADVHVTLEPCSHFGRTPPCAEALVAAKVRAVHVAMIDPDRNVAGRGIEKLREAGVAVSVGDGEAAAQTLLEGYVKHRTTGLPFVVVKFAATLDGKIAAASGDSRWVAGEASRAHAHEFRRRVDAIICGVNNVLLDDPQLTARPAGVATERQPLRVVADSRGRTPPDAQVLGPGGPTIIATTGASPEDWRQGITKRGGEVCVMPPDADGRVNLRALAQLLAQRGVLMLLAEGGGVLHGGLFATGLVDKVHAYVAPKIVGGTAFPAVAGPGAVRMSDAVVLRQVEIERLGEDVFVSGYVGPVQ